MLASYVVNKGHSPGVGVDFVHVFRDVDDFSPRGDAVREFQLVDGHPGI